MKRRSSILYSIAAVVVLQSGNSFSQTIASTEGYSIGASASLYVPTGSLSSRFRSTYGYSIAITKNSAEDPALGFSLERFIFQKENSGKLFITRNVSVAGSVKQFQIPLSKLKMKLEITGASVNFNYRPLTNKFVEASLGFGVGIYRWDNTRGEFRDTLNVDTSGVGGFKRVDVLNIPESRQQDWSGGFDVGANVDLLVLQPLRISVGGRYKFIVGELWPAIALDMENVSGFQMFQLSLGVKFDFEL